MFPRGPGRGGGPPFGRGGPRFEGNRPPFEMDRRPGDFPPSRPGFHEGMHRPPPPHGRGYPGPRLPPPPAREEDFHFPEADYAFPGEDEWEENLKNQAREPPPEDRPNVDGRPPLQDGPSGPGFERGRSPSGFNHDNEFHRFGGPPGQNRGPPGFNGPPRFDGPGFDRGPPGPDRGTPGHDRGPPGHDRGPLGPNRGPPDYDRGPPGPNEYAHGPHGYNRGPHELDRRGPPDNDRGPAYDQDRGPPMHDRSFPREDDRMRNPQFPDDFDRRRDDEFRGDRNHDDLDSHAAIERRRLQVQEEMEELRRHKEELLRGRMGSRERSLDGSISSRSKVEMMLDSLRQLEHRLDQDESRRRESPRRER